MLAKYRLFVRISVALPIALPCYAALPSQTRDCRRAVIEGEVSSGQSLFRPVGNGLALFLQPIVSGWILRVIPASGPRAELDYAELATPPYNSVTPLSVSTDFSFRAQDAIGWNPRRFRFATSQRVFEQLSTVYRSLPMPPARVPDSAQHELAVLLPQTSEGTFRILDSRLIPGSADQASTAVAVASHLASTAHTVVRPSVPTSLGKLLWIRFRVELNLPRSYKQIPSLRVDPFPCAVLQP